MNDPQFDDQPCFSNRFLAILALMAAGMIYAVIWYFRS